MVVGVTSTEVKESLEELAGHQRFLDEFSNTYGDSLNILQVDNGRFHTRKDLVVPDNVMLLFQPAYFVPAVKALSAGSHQWHSDEDGDRRR